MNLRSLASRALWLFGPRRVLRGRNDTAYLNSSKKNAAILQAAIDELNAGRGKPMPMAEVRRQLRGGKTPQ
jgi:hypothetical protein